MKQPTHNRQILRNSFSKEVEAAWYVLKPFFHPLDCAEQSTYSIQDPQGNGTKVKSGVYPLNVNYVLASILSGDNRYRPQYMTKSKLAQHLNQIKTYYYRSAYQAIYSKGYGSHANQALKLPFAQDLGITSKRISYPDTYYIMLVGIDIDAHHGELDSLAVEQWLKTYFPESYWEPSSSFTGRHGYLKLAYPCNLGLSTIIRSLKFLFSLLDQKRISLGFQSSIDVPCGLPSTLTLVPEYPYIEEELEDLTGSSPQEISISVLTQLTGKDYSLGPVQDQFIKLKRSQAFKFPRFNRTHSFFCSMDDIISFFRLEFFPYSFITNLIETLSKELNLNPGGDNKKSEEEYPVSIVCSPQNNNRPKSIGWQDIVGQEMSLVDYWTTKSKKKSSKINYQKKIEGLKTLQDSKKKTGLFYWNYSVYLHRVPTAEEAITEYIRQGLNSNPNVDSKQRKRRFNYCYRFILKRFDESRCGFHLDDWGSQKEVCINLIQTHLSDQIQLKWKMNSQKQYALTVDELALVYFSIKKSNEYDKTNSDKIIRNSFSYKRLKSIFKMVLNKGCHRAKCGRILQVLQEINLIEKTGNYICSVRGNCYKVKTA
jgi:hypothetical protein